MPAMISPRFLNHGPEGAVSISYTDVAVLPLLGLTGCRCRLYAGAYRGSQPIRWATTFLSARPFNHDDTRVVRERSEGKEICPDRLHNFFCGLVFYPADQLFEMTGKVGFIAPDMLGE